jgi:protein TIF31
MKIVQNDQSVDHALPAKKGAILDGTEPVPGAQQPLLELEQSTIEKDIKKQLKSSQYTKCIESIQFSCFNPVPHSRRLAGDLFYLTVKTLDAGERGITCSVNGFYLNDSVEKTHFSPTPS